MSEQQGHDAETSAGARRSSVPAPGRRVVAVHRIGAAVVALVVAVIGVLGFVGSLGFFDTQGTPVLGLTTNGALSTVSVVTAAVLLLAAARGGRTASSVMIVIGALFLVSAFVNLWLIGTPHNVLAFGFPNVAFSIVAGLVLLFLGAYGRVTGRRPTDNPYGPGDPAPQVSPEPAVAPTSDRADVEADAALADATRAQATGTASDEQQRRLAATERARTQEERRRLWRSFDEATRGPDADSPRGRRGTTRT